MSEVERFRSAHHLNEVNKEVREARTIKDGSKDRTIGDVEETNRIILEAAYRKALDTETDQIQEENFSNVYTADEIESNLRLVRDLEEKFAQQNESEPSKEEIMRLGRILEAIVIEQIELNEWLGEHVKTQQTTRFDDYTNGIDFIAEFEDIGKHLGFAIDATSGHDKTIEKKLDRIRKKIMRGEMGEVRYFRSSDGFLKGKMELLPTVVLAIERKTLVHLARLWVQGKQSELARHPVKYFFFHEVLVQLEAQLRFAKELKERGKLKNEYILVRLNEQVEFMKKSVPDDLMKVLDQNFDHGHRYVSVLSSRVFSYDYEK
jgi:hypothetical protein